MDLGLDKIKFNQNRLTKQRLAILNYLKNTKKHPSADKVYLTLKSQIPNLSLATVYRNLKYFQKIGLIEDIGANQKTARFDGDNSRHFHFICDQCGKIDDIFDLNLLNLALMKTKYPLINKVNLNIYGLCLKCGAPQLVYETNNRAGITG